MANTVCELKKLLEAKEKEHMKLHTEWCEKGGPQLETMAKKLDTLLEECNYLTKEIEGKNMKNENFRFITYRVINFNDLKEYMLAHNWCTEESHVCDVIEDTFFDYGKNLEQKANDSFIFDLSVQIFQDCYWNIWGGSSIGIVNGTNYIMSVLVNSLCKTLIKYINLEGV